MGYANTAPCLWLAFFLIRSFGVQKFLILINLSIIYMVIALCVLLAIFTYDKSERNPALCMFPDRKHIPLELPFQPVEVQPADAPATKASRQPFSATRFIIVKAGRQSKCPSTDNTRLSEWRHIQTRQYCEWGNSAFDDVQDV